MPTNYNWLIATEKRIVWLSELHKLFHFSHFFSNILSKIPKIFVSRSVFSTKNCPLSSYFCSSIVTVRIISSHSFSNFSGCFYSQQICSSFIFVIICLWVISFSSRCEREKKQKIFFIPFFVCFLIDFKNTSTFVNKSERKNHFWFGDDSKENNYDFRNCYKYSYILIILYCIKWT